MKSILISILLLVSSCSLVSDNQTLPSNLAGVWLSNDAKFIEHILVSGVAVYLTENGSGGIFAAPPMLGRRINAVYDVESQVISFNELNSHGKVVRQGTIKYITKDNTLIFELAKSVVLTKEADVISRKTKRLLGI